MVIFTWRHWGYWEGPYEGREPSNEMVELYGLCVVPVNDQLKIEAIEVYFDPNPFIANFMGKSSGCPMQKASQS